ncbi:hypothetical protein [Pseudarthrobacter albicanus]|uniref:hypothetical protein n=1 Tax=Pseudarthrobacter albicanus TaxID=2823873 RepID=UPI0027DDE5FD|nr:hypothetical protein [Pseudarthrobacter albicanus]
MEDSGAEDSGTAGNGSNDQRSDGGLGGLNGFDQSAARQDAEEDHRGRRGFARFARPALIAGSVIAIVCVALLVIIFFLDSFNATIYSVGGKDVRDATEEARSIRDTYAAARLGGIMGLAIGVVLAAAGGLMLYRHRNEPARDDEANGEDVDFEDLAGQ